MSALVRRAKVLGNFEVISGGETADIPFASWAARELDLPLVYIRKEAKERGTSKRIEGAIEILKGRRVLHISDLITDGGSAKDWVQAIREADGIVENYFAIFDRKQGGEETLRQRGVKLHSLVQLNDEFLKIGIGTSMIQSDYTEIKQYLADPETWARTFILSDPNWIKSKGEKGKLILQNGYPDLIPLL